MAYLEIVITAFFGILSGIITGLVPGIHVNLVSVLVVTFSPLLLDYVSPFSLGVYIISLALTHTFLDAIPSIYLGAPDEAQALAALPGHRLLIQGLGHNAVLCTVIGSLGCVILGVLLFPLFISTMSWLQPLVAESIGYLLIIMMIFMIWRERKKWLFALVAFLLSGVLGLLVFSIPSVEQPLFPLLSGLFGISLLITGLSENIRIPLQKTAEPLQLSRRNMMKTVSAASGVGYIAAFLPGFGSSQAAIVATNAVGDVGDEGFLTLIGGINTANMLISIATVYALDKARNGAIVAVQQLMTMITYSQLLQFIALALIVAGVSSLLTIYCSKLFASMIVKVSYPLLIRAIIIFITALTLYFDGFVGLLILVTATALGYLCSRWGIGKSHLLGCLILPVILYFTL
ncbi:tripartite tricarboxylate transporter permease [Candidatus Woesearchaeota archaeon]|nr:tripartite tricarboxylate transporter permease [Candidatus Woesearchaeota archaeon]